MKQKFLKFSMFVGLSLLTSTLFAQDMKAPAIETKLTENGKQWVWYSNGTPGGAVNESASKSESYAFSPKHTVEITVDGKKTSTTWKISQATVTLPSQDATAKPTPTTQTTLVIGATSYVLSFGSDKTHTEYMVLAHPKLGSNYYYSLLPR